MGTTSGMSSDIRVFVKWRDQCVFAGEDVECTITFKNIANPHGNLSPSGPMWPSRRRGSFNTMLGTSAAPEYRRSPSTNASFKNQSFGHGRDRHHRGTGSLSLPAAPIISPRSPLFSPGNDPKIQSPRQHQRSISIVSLGSGDLGKGTSQTPFMIPPSRPGYRHNRSASAQVLPRRKESVQNVRSSVSYGAYKPQADEIQSTNGHGNTIRLNLPRRPSHQGSKVSSSSTSPNPSRKSSPLANDSFTFPSETKEKQKECTSKAIKNLDVNDTKGTAKRKSPVADAVKSASRHDAPLASRVLSGVSVDENARDSGEFYSTSNISTDTLASEQVPLSTQRLLHPAPQNGRYPTIRRPKPEKLLMGYAQISATFLVDGSLIDQSHFDEVKRKGFLGGQGGGGVVGVETPRSGPGLFGGFNFSGISESIGGLLGGVDMTSTKEMKGVTASRTIPLLSTPQSLLFVDLQLDPGEERSFSFVYSLPRGLPASHKGKAIKTSYNLTIGTQWAPSPEKMQKVRQVNVPFRVFSGVNADGQILGHDLMQPYVILQDQSQTKSAGSKSAQTPNRASKTTKDQELFASAFLSYTSDKLNPKNRRLSSTTMLSQTHLNTMKEAIEHAILLSNQPTSSKSPNHFSITRNARQVGHVTLNRPLHRLGETVSANIDFTAGEITCFSLRCMLETVEKVDPSLALRSAASIARVTRRVHATLIENTLFANRVAFMPTIPVFMAPTLLTSGVELEWRLRFEFVTAKAIDTEQEAQREDTRPFDLLEEIARDDRGVAMAGIEAMACEMFEVVIPITVFGDAVHDSGEEDESIGYPI